MEETKRCTKCEQINKLGEFHRNKRHPDGLSYWCKSCVKKRDREYHQKNKTRFREQTRKWRQSNKDNVNARNRKYYLKRQYGLSLEQADKFWGAKKCEICGSNNPKRKDMKFLIDHCHRTGRLRGALCSFCNSGIGYFLDSTENLMSAIEYLNKYNGTEDDSGDYAGDTSLLPAMESSGEP